MLRTCTARGCTTIVFGSGTCVEHDRSDRPAQRDSFEHDVTRTTRPAETLGGAHRANDATETAAHTQGKRLRGHG